MSNSRPARFRRCFVSAPFGLSLGILPELLSERNISWEWAKEAPYSSQSASVRIADADFVLVILNGTKADYRGAFDAGIAIGLRKPVFLLQTRARALPLDFRQFTTVKSSVLNREALKFHLDLFLVAPDVLERPDETERATQEHPIRSHSGRDRERLFDSELERRVYDAVIAAGGSAVSEPRSDLEVKFRPDLLAWLGNLDAELLDPVVIEVKARADSKAARRLEEQLLNFMQLARIRTALVVTAFPPPEREQQLSPNVLWLTVDKFEALSRTAELGTYVRESRNRILHGVR